MLRQTRWLFLITILIFTSIICGLSLNRKSRLTPPNEKLPDRDIAFWKDTNILGFINPDGSGLETRNIQVSGGLISDLIRFNVPPQITQIVTWSFDGNYLATRYTYYNPNNGVPLIISKEGKIFQCPFEAEHLSGIGHVYFTKEGNIITALYSIYTGENRVVRLNLYTCKEIAQLYAIKTHYYIKDISFSNQNWLAVDVVLGEYDEKIAVSNEDLQYVFEIPQAYSPAWSPDGKILTYLMEDGLYVVDQNGKNAQKIISGKYYYPAWSPDGQWLAYNEGRTIYKFNINTKEKVKIYVGAAEFSWK